jgi:hypothetical protein
MIEQKHPQQPLHPQQKFGSGFSTWAQAYPNLAAYGYDVNFTVMDMLDSLAARVKLLEEAIQKEGARDE